MLGFLIGKVSEEDLLGAAKADPDGPEAICAATFCVGMTRSLTGNRKAAIEMLRRCVDTGLRGSVAYESAKAELERLESE